MKKKRPKQEILFRDFRKLLRMMKLVFVCLLLGTNMMWAGLTYSQATSLNLNLNNVELEEVFDAIRKQSEFEFFYNNDQINTSVKVSIQSKEADITEILDQILPEAYEYKINDRYVQISKRKAVNPTPTLSLQPQQTKKTITGTVVDKNGEAIIGANIVEKGTTNGTISDLDGKFSLNISEASTLQISYIGYIMLEIPIKNQTNLTITLQEDHQALDEVVIIAYGTTKRKDFTGSVTSIKMENSPIALAANLHALETLKGNVAGLDIGATTSAGGEPSMQVRGQNSISGSNDPLIVLDGVIFLGNISDINPNDIATFDILKDATSAAAYGSRSANGVIVISTKKGRTGKPIINLNVTGSIQNWHLKPELMRGEKWLNMVRDKNRYEDYSFLNSQQQINYNAGKEVNWLDEVTRTGWIQDYQLSVSGAGEKMNYYLSTSYTDNKSILEGDEFSRMTVLGKVNTDITNWLQLGIDAAYSHADYSGKAANLQNTPILTPYDMLYRNETEKLLEKFPNGQSEAENALWGVNDKNFEDVDIRNNIRVNAFMLVKVPWINGLTYRLNYAGNLDFREIGEFYHESYYAPIGPYDDESRYSITTQQNYLTNANGKLENIKTTSWVIDNILNYKNTFGKHTIDLTAVITRDSHYYRLKRMRGSDFFANGNTSLGLEGLNYATTQKIENENQRRRNVGYFGRLSYSFNDTYYLTGSYRRDGASVFGSENKWGNFGAVGLSWRITNESFMKNIIFLDDLKLKLSWGKNGNQGIAPYGTLSRVKAGASGGIYYTFGNSGQTVYGIKQDVIGNANLGWETTESWNTGFEATFFEGLLSVDLDAYFSRTSDQIFNRTIPVMTGFKEMKSSMGEVRNHGVEITLRLRNIQTNDFSWHTGLTFWLNRNKLNRLYGDDMNGDGKEDDDIGNNLFIGHSIHSIYGYKQDGIVQKEDVEYMEKNGVQPGTPKYVDLNGDGVITIEDRSIIGNKAPNFKLNMNNTLAWKDLELYIMLSGTFGGNGYFQESNKPAFMAAGRGDMFLANNIYIPYWTENNPSNKYPAAWFLGDDYFLGLQSRAYVRLQDVTLSYTFNQSFIKNMGINNLRVFFSGKNLFTITGWKGGDPESGKNYVTAPASDKIKDSWPVSTTFSLGAQVSF